MKKKILAMVLCICLVGGLLAGCSSDNTNYCLGSWKLCNGNGAEDSAIKSTSIDLLKEMGLDLQDLVVLTINEDGTVQEYLCGALVQGKWTKKSGTKSTIEFEGIDQTYGGTVVYKDNLLTYKTDNGDTLYFEKTDRNAKKMSEQFNAKYSSEDPTKAFLNKAADSVTSAAALLLVQQIQSGKEALLDELFTKLGQYYYTLPATDQQNIKVWIDEYKAAIK